MPNQNNQKSNRQKGALNEHIALQYLLENGFEFIEKNFYTSYGEIDLIMKKDNVLHFIEVKSGSFINPLLHITQQKVDRLIKSIHVFLAKYNHNGEFCLDAVIVQDDKVEFIGNITI